MDMDTDKDIDTDVNMNMNIWKKKIFIGMLLSGYRSNSRSNIKNNS